MAVEKSHKFDEKNDDVVLISPHDMITRGLMAPIQGRMHLIMAVFEKSELEKLYGHIENGNGPFPIGEPGKIKAMWDFGPLSSVDKAISLLQGWREELKQASIDFEIKKNLDNNAEEQE